MKREEQHIKQNKQRTSGDKLESSDERRKTKEIQRWDHTIQTK